MTSSTDLETLVRLGDALWADPARSRPQLRDSVSAASLRDLSDGRLVECAGAALLGNALRFGSAANAQANGHRLAEPFYRRLPEERFVLVALHQGRWSYARLARVLDETPEQVEELAWAARVSLAASARGVGALPISYPVGSQGARCPEYLPSRPWTQRFLDEEFKTSGERLFLQNHLMACAACRESLKRCRDLYFSIESLMPQPDLHAADAPGMSSSAQAVTSFTAELRQLCARGERSRSRGETPVLGSLAVFLQKRDTQLILAGGFVLSLALKIALSFRHHV